MEFRSIWALRGPNYWANYPVLEARVDLGRLRDCSSAEMPGFNERLQAWLPSLVNHRCSVGEVGGFFQRLQRGTYLAHILEHVALELQNLAGGRVGFGRARATDEDGVYRVVIEYDEEEVGRAALESGRRLCLAAVDGQPFDVAAEVQRLRSLAHDVGLGPSTAAIVRAARARRIPTLRLSRDSLVQLGHGARARRICTAETDRTSALAETVAQDKQLTRWLLRVVGVPVPCGRPVGDEEDAWQAAQEIGLPVVVKPQFGNHGRGVATNLSTREQVVTAYRAARDESSYILVEQFAPGDDHRLLVVGERLVAAARREPAHVVGDGRRTVAELVAEVNRDPRRSDGHSTVLSFIKLDSVGLAVLAEQACTPESVPPPGTRVLIRRNGNLSTGGTATDVTELVHPDVAAAAVEAARVVGLDIAGVDVVACDISRPLETQRGMVVEVNAGPGLRMHIEPTAGAPRPVGEAIVATLFPPGENGRIPLVGIAGTADTTQVARILSQLLAADGTSVGLVSREGVWVGTRRIDADTSCGPEWARALLMNPMVQAAVVETAPEQILMGGLGYDRSNVGVVTAIAEGELPGLPADMDERVRLLATVPDAVLRTGTVVLNADDPRVLGLCEKSQAEVIFYSRVPNHPHIAEHVRLQGRAVLIVDRGIWLVDGDRREVLSLPDGAATNGTPTAEIVAPLLAAIAAAWGGGLKADELRTRLPACIAAGPLVAAS